MALEKLGLEYMYQVPVAGVRKRMGGPVVDFVVIRPPSEVLLLVRGEYWHEQS